MNLKILNVKSRIGPINLYRTRVLHRVYDVTLIVSATHWRIKIQHFRSSSRVNPPTEVRPFTVDLEGRAQLKERGWVD